MPRKFWHSFNSSQPYTLLDDLIDTTVNSIVFQNLNPSWCFWQLFNSSKVHWTILIGTAPRNLRNIAQNVKCLCLPFEINNMYGIPYRYILWMSFKFHSNKATKPSHHRHLYFSPEPTSDRSVNRNCNNELIMKKTILIFGSEVLPSQLSFQKFLQNDTPHKFVCCSSI